MVHLERLKNNVRKHRDIELATTEKKMLASVRAKLSQNKIVFREFTGNRNEQTKVTLNKVLHTGLPILDISKIEYWFDCK